MDANEKSLLVGIYVKDFIIPENTHFVNLSLRDPEFLILKILIHSQENLWYSSGCDL